MDLHSSSIVYSAGGTVSGVSVKQQTLLSHFHRGRPRSRAKDQDIREAEATIEMLAQMTRAVTTADMAVAPPRDCIPC